jgi:hypothetical protein
VTSEISIHPTLGQCPSLSYFSFSYLVSRVLFIGDFTLWTSPYVGLISYLHAYVVIMRRFFICIFPFPCHSLIFENFRRCMIAGGHALQMIVKDVSKYFMQTSRIREVFLINFTEWGEL